MPYILIDGQRVEVKRLFLAVADVADALGDTPGEVLDLLADGVLSDVAVHGTEPRLDPDEVVAYAEEQVAARRLEEDVYVRLAALITRRPAR